MRKTFSTYFVPLSHWKITLDDSNVVGSKDFQDENNHFNLCSSLLNSLCFLTLCFETENHNLNWVDINPIKAYSLHD